MIVVIISIIAENKIVCNYWCGLIMFKNIRKDLKKCDQKNMNRLNTIR